MPRLCSICTHPEREAIDRELVESPQSNRGVSRRYAVSGDALQRHRLRHIGPLLARAAELERGRDETLHGQALHVQASAREAAQDAHALDVMAELRRCFVRVNLLFDACDRWLRDPENPDQYDISPRSDDVAVVYLEPGPAGLPVRRKAKLSRLLAKLEDSGVDVDRGEIKVADPRELVLKAAGQLSDQVTLLAKLVGELDERPQVSVTLSAEWLSVRTVLLSALTPFPDARAAVAGALLGLDGAA